MKMFFLGANYEKLRNKLYGETAKMRPAQTSPIITLKKFDYSILTDNPILVILLIHS